MGTGMLCAQECCVHWNAVCTGKQCTQVSCVHRKAMQGSAKGNSNVKYVTVMWEMSGQGIGSLERFQQPVHTYI